MIASGESPERAGSGRAVAVIGAQWGDEGKGKIVDLLSEQADVIVRFHGGNNAGHTLVVGRERLVLHLVPAGALHPGKVCVIGNGVVIDPAILLREIDELRGRGHLRDDGCLKVSTNAHVIMPYHRVIDRGREERLGSRKIGTTGRGIGPAYEDKMARTGIRIADLMDEVDFRERLAPTLEEKNAYLTAVLGERPLTLDAVMDEYGRYREALRPYVANTARYVDAALERGARVLFEGAQGTMLDVDHGTYPFVTSSTTVAGGIAAGAGIPAHRVGTVIGITKAYTTRVGAGPFPTELTDATGDKLRSDGDEFGATTGRPRRCGWFDGVVVREAVRLNGCTSLAVTKLDVLSGLDRVRVCRGYEVDGKTVDELPSTPRGWEALRPMYDELGGWSEDLSGVRRLEDLPRNARAYLARIEELAQASAALVSVGAGREQTILLRDPFAS